MATVAVLGPSELAAIQAVMAYAHDPAHFYDIRTKPLGPSPGDTPAHVVQLGTLRIVYSVTTIGPCAHGHHPFHHFRLLSASGLGGLSIPSPAIVAHVAVHFGFNTGDPSFQIGLNQRERALVMIQELEHAVARAVR